MCFEAVNNGMNEPLANCNSLPFVAEFSRICRVSSGTETEDKGIRVSLIKHRSFETATLKHTCCLNSF